MTTSMLAKPNTAQYRFALYTCGHRLDLVCGPEQPIALYADQDLARAHGARLWPTTFEVVDLHARGGDGVRSMAVDRLIYNGHTHGGGPVPTQQQ